MSPAPEPGPAPQITGTTRIIAHLGVPTESFTAPMIYNPYFAARGIDAVVVPMGLEAADLAAFLPPLFRLRNIAGALVTMPHKRSIVALLDRVSPAVRICGACNAVRRGADGELEGDMFDGMGFVRGLETRGRTAAGASVLVVGAGGVGAAIAAALAAAGATRIALHDTNVTAARDLAARLARHYPEIRIITGTHDPADYAVVVNATPLGMEPGDPLPLDPARLDPSSLAGDVVLRAEETPFLAAARARGCDTQPGIDMLFEQIPAYLDFFGLPPANAAELRRLARIAS